MKQQNNDSDFKVNIINDSKEVYDNGEHDGDINGEDIDRTFDSMRDNVSEEQWLMQEKWDKNNDI